MIAEYILFPIQGFSLARRAIALAVAWLKTTDFSRWAFSKGGYLMTVVEYIAKHAGELAKCNSRQEIYEACVKGGVDAPVAEFQASIQDMNFLYKVLKGIFEDGKMDEAKVLFETIKKVVDEKAPN
jgi:hypothetical protein